MPQKRIPTPSQDAGNWGTILNEHIAQTKNPINGAFNSFDQFSARPTNLTADDAGRTYLYTQTGNWHEWSGTEWKVQNKSEINVKDYGAVGVGIPTLDQFNNKGLTPLSHSIDITNATWNKWPQFLIGGEETDPIALQTRASYNPWNSLNPPTPKPFNNNDTWDYIGIQLSIWNTYKSDKLKTGDVVIPAGEYYLTKPLFFGYLNNPRVRGLGHLQTNIYFQDISTHPITDIGNGPAKSLIFLYRLGGYDTKIKDLRLSGPSGYNYNDNLVLISQTNGQGVIFDNLWINNSEIGIDTNTFSEFIARNCIFEYNKIAMKVDEGTIFDAKHNNIWQSATGVSFKGIESEGRTIAVGNRFFGFNGISLKTGRNSLVTDNYFFLLENSITPVSLGEGSTFSGNVLDGNFTPMVTKKMCTIMGNIFNQKSNHSCIDIQQLGTTKTTGCIVSGNTFSVGSVILAEGGVINSTEQGISYSAGCTNCIVTNNSFDYTGPSQLVNISSQNNVVSNNLS